MEKQQSAFPRGYSTVIPGETTVIQHNLGTLNIIISLYNVATGNELNSGITVVDENTVKIVTASGAPAEIRVVIFGF